MRKKIVAGNWKMNLSVDEGIKLINEINRLVGDSISADQLILFPPFIHLLPIIENKDGSIAVGAQNCHQKESGAYTGEVSAAMIRSANAQYVIIGHSERRTYFNEDNSILAEKIKMALTHQLEVIYCCGESLEEREDNQHFEVIKKQLEEGVFHLNKHEFTSIIIAYEPLWAIGTGKTASVNQAQEMHAYIRQLIEQKFGSTIAENTSVLYGGSCKANNATELFKQKDVDGGLIGGASLDATEFIQIANSF